MYEPVTPSLVYRHLRGLITCAWSAIDETISSRTLCFDSDTNDGSLDRLESFLREYNWNLIREGRRPGRDGHLWLLFDTPLKADVLITLGNAMMTLSGTTGIERFPKSSRGYSQIRGPLGINLKPEAQGARGWFDDVEQDVLVQLEWLAAQPLNRAEDAMREAQRHRPIPPNSCTKIPKNALPYRGFDILNYVEARREGNGFVAACPCCRSEGHDRHGDNLHISSDGKKFCCWFGGQPSGIHRARAIVSALLVKSRNLR
jgi:hypothetical protein